MQTVKHIEASNVKVGDVITSHGRTNKTVTAVMHGESGKWHVSFHGGRVTYDYDDILAIKTAR